ncbi:GTP-binding protein [Dactylosporangium sp. NPDC049140]|uniref:GTP-binding protein n=1 Tax=Dactylosporangium sp. NPDC049140 TaxID=3155647 RepID=UPI0033C02DAF
MSAPSSARTLRIAFVGEVDHGKSTLVGRLLLDTRGAMGRLAVPVREGGLAFLLDALAEERAELFTLDTAEAVVTVGDQVVVFIDVPGHFALLRNMVTGSSRADLGVVVVDAVTGAAEQTRRHLRILELLGVTAAVCAVTKMDLAGYREEAFAAVAAQVGRIAAEVGIDLVAGVPVSALEGALVTQAPAPQMPWYRGPSLLDTVGQVGARRQDSACVRFAVQSRLGARVLGHVASGVLRPGVELVAVGGGPPVRVEAIERYGEPPLDRAGPGDSVGLRVSGGPPAAGAILAPPADPPMFGDLWSVRLLNIGDRPLRAGDPCTIRYASARASGVLDATHPPDGIGFAEIAGGRIRLDAPAAADPARHCPATGRFMLCDVQGVAVGLGLVDGVAQAAPAGRGNGVPV